MSRGDHLYVRRTRHYSHHGIDCGDGTVVHYVGPRRSIRHVARTSMADFAQGDDVQLKTYDRRLSADETVRNAESRIGSVGYHLVRNNCEHFAAWCSTGRARSAQVRRWALAAQGTFAAFVAAQPAGLHLVVVGSVGAGLYAFAGPFRRG